jgi:hypothetical protein
MDVLLAFIFTFLLLLYSLKFSKEPDTSYCRSLYIVIPAKAGIPLSAFTLWMAQKRFTLCRASAGMTDLFLLNRSV